MSEGSDATKPQEAPPPQQQDPIIGRLREDVRVIRQGAQTMLFDPTADAYYQISSEALQIVQYLSEPMKLSDFTARLNARGISCSKEEVARVVAFCQQSNLMVPQFGEVTMKRKKMEEMKKKTWFLRFCSAYLFFKLPPLRPERVFLKIAPYVSWMCSKPMVMALLIPAIFGYLLLIRDASAVRAAFVDSLSWAGLAKYMVAIVLLKVVHESAHSLAAIHFGCRVRGIGIGFMVFVPRLFTDTTDAWRLSRAKRLLIDGAGIMSELLVGGIAAIFWSYAPPGPWRSTAFYIFAVSTISTLLVNGNPCIRYDGYYILSDIVGMPNLMHRATEYLKNWWRHIFLRLGPYPTGDHGIFLITFGIATFIYRIFLYTGIILIIYHQFTKAIALVMMVLELYSILIYPFWREVQTIRQLSKRSASHAGIYLLSITAAVLSIILFLPMGWDVELLGEVTTSERDLVTIEENGYLADGMSAYARPVKQGEIICRLYAPDIAWTASRLAAETEADAMTRRFAAIDSKRYVEVGILDAKLRSDKAATTETMRRTRSLTIRAAKDGIFLPIMAKELSANAHLLRGYQLGEILHGEKRIIAYARDRDVGKLSIGDEAKFRVGDRLGTMNAKVVAIESLPGTIRSSPLLQPFGGPVPVYFEQGIGDGMHFMPVETLYRVVLVPDEDADVDYGRVVHVAIPHREQFWTRVKAYLLSSFRREF